ncbi:MAG: GNAT family N-acetyltransferase [Alphaproteobacteria bacterium]|nr:GNAT family N-acetyltransferase [Alphaproteobacteria bacterium]
MILVGSDAPAFFQAASIMRKYLPHIVFDPQCQIIYEDDRYYGLITVHGDTINYDHVILDKFVCNPEIIFIVMSTLFSMGSIVNTYIEEDNAQAQRFVKGVGFINTGTLRQTPKSLAIWSMTKDEWKNNRIKLHFEKQTLNQ